jgi:hypothetical protein
MPQWKRPVARSFSGAEFRAYVGSQTFSTWRPRFVVVHNTSVPSLSNWHLYTGAQRMRGFEHYYRDEKHWSAGPHLFVADDLIWVFTPLTTSGVHSPSWNAFSWGVEIVGDFMTEAFAGAVAANAVDALATLHETIGLDPMSMRPHHDDPLTDHKDCPGVHLEMPALKDRVLAELVRRQQGDHGPDALRAVVPRRAPRAGKPARSRARRKTPRAARRGK